MAVHHFEPDLKRTHWKADLARAASGRCTPRMWCIYPDVVSRCFQSGRTGLDWRLGELRKRSVFEVLGAKSLNARTNGDRYERGLTATTGSFQLIYRIARRFTLRAQSGQDSSIDLIWTWRWK